jgi:hypothetical protein
MHFLVDNENKIIFGWSPKCGCSHIKSIYWYFKEKVINSIIHTNRDFCELPDNIEEYTTIIIIRNPYKKIISGFLDKYCLDGEFRHVWIHDTITFSMFVNMLENNEWSIVCHHHFSPQTEGDFDQRVLKSKIIKFYDIGNIDYKYIEELYHTEIPDEVLHIKYGHERKKYEESIKSDVYDVDMDSYVGMNVDIQFFYNKELKNRVYQFYKNDFILFSEYGFDYEEEMNRICSFDS